MPSKPKFSCTARWNLDITLHTLHNSDLDSFKPSCCKWAWSIVNRYLTSLAPSCWMPIWTLGSFVNFGEMLHHRVLDNLLAEEELVPCSFSADAADLGYLDPLGGNHRDLVAGAQVFPWYWPLPMHSDVLIRWSYLFGWREPLPRKIWYFCSVICAANVDFKSCRFKLKPRKNTGHELEMTLWQVRWLSEWLRRATISLKLVFLWLGESFGSFQCGGCANTCSESWQTMICSVPWGLPLAENDFGISWTGLWTGTSHMSHAKKNYSYAWTFSASSRSEDSTGTTQDFTYAEDIIFTAGLWLYLLVFYTLSWIMWNRQSMREWVQRVEERHSYKPKGQPNTQISIQWRPKWQSFEENTNMKSFRNCK